MAKDWALDPQTKTVGREVKADPRDRIEVIVGDDKQPDFKPQFKVMRWDNEVNFSLRAEEHPAATVSVIDGKVIYATTDLEVHQYEKPPDKTNEDGQFEFEWVLLVQPASNVLTATIQQKGLRFHYQPPLTLEDIAEGAFQPENVVGSYAAYHATKGVVNLAGGKDYKTGKAFHIYRPKATDANGAEVWCDLHIDEALGLLTVTVPQRFLNTAVYPVTVDPTFGYTTAGGSTLNLVGVNMFCSIVGAYVATTGDVVTSISMYGRTVIGTNGFLNVAPYTVVAGVVTTQLGANENLTVGTTTPGWWNTAAITRNLTNGVQYGVAVVYASGNDSRIYYDAGSPPGRFNSTLSAMPGDGGSFSPTGTDSGRQYSLYATYTVAAAGRIFKLAGLGGGLAGPARGLAG